MFKSQLALAKVAFLGRRPLASFPTLATLLQPNQYMCRPSHAGLLHVTAFQAGSCLERFGDIDSLTAPPLQPLSSALDRAASANSNRVVSEAICLATPPDNPTADTENQRVVVRHVARPNSSSSGVSTTSGTLSRAAGGLRSNMEEALQFELQSHERALMLNMYTAEVLQASSHVRRQRRRAVIRALRASRDTGRALLEAPAAAIASCLASLDGTTGDSSSK
jgi:hypothetical protein